MNKQDLIDNDIHHIELYAKNLPDELTHEQRMWLAGIITKLEDKIKGEDS